MRASPRMAVRQPPWLGLEDDARKENGSMLQEDLYGLGE